MAGNERLVERILADARDQAAAIVNSAERKAAERTAAAEAWAKEQTDLGRVSAEQEGEELIRRRKTVAALEVKKLCLKHKRICIDKAFSRALEKLCALPEADCRKWIEQTLQAQADEGDVVILAEGCPVSDDYVKGLPVYAERRLKGVRRSNDFSGGMVLSGSRFDKSLTYESLLAESRQALETEVSGLLF